MLSAEKVGSIAESLSSCYQKWLTQYWICK